MGNREGDAVKELLDQFAIVLGLFAAEFQWEDAFLFSEADIILPIASITITVCALLIPIKVKTIT